MIGLYALLIGLAAYRLWRILAEDTITHRFRDWLYARPDAVSVFISDLVSCVWCIGFWYSVAGAWVISDREHYDPAQFAILALAASATAGLMRATVDRLT